MRIVFIAVRNGFPAYVLSKIATRPFRVAPEIYGRLEETEALSYCPNVYLRLALVLSRRIIFVYTLKIHEAVLVMQIVTCYIFQTHYSQQ
jgi:hypothetical protein